MTPEEFTELDRVFHEALELARPERETLILRVQARSPRIAHRLRTMLGADESLRISKIGDRLDELY